MNTMKHNNMNDLNKTLKSVASRRGSESAETAGYADDVKRLTEGLKDIHGRLTGNRGNPKWVIGHIENLLAGREHWRWE